MFDIAYTKVVEFKYHQYFNSSTTMLPKMGVKIKCARTGGWGKRIFLLKSPAARPRKRAYWQAGKNEPASGSFLFCYNGTI